MVIRRIREHVATHNWFAVMIDLAIVVIGVFLGTQVNNWNLGRIDRANAGEYRRQIIANIEVNEADAIARIAYYRQVRAHAVAALRALQQPGAPPSEPFLIDAYQASQAFLRPFEQTAYEELISSGVIRQVGDSETRAKLSAYYVSARGFDNTALSMTAYRDRLRRIMDFDVQERIRARCDDIARLSPGGSVGVSLPTHCDLGLDPALAARAVEELRSAPELAQDLTRHIGDLDQKLALFDRTLRAARSLRATLERTSA